MADKARATLPHSVGIVEWFENSPQGLKHNIALGGDLSPALSDDGSAVLLRTADGAMALRYGELHTFDAADRTLPSRFELAGDALRIVVDAAGASFPITIDPLIIAPAWEAYGIAVNDELGFALAAGDFNGDGRDDLAVGAPLYDATAAEANEGAVTIVSDDAPPQAHLHYATALSQTYKLSEGTPGVHTTQYVNEVELIGSPSSLTATVTVRVFAQSAAAGTDYVSPGAIVLTFPPGLTARQFSFGISPDFEYEPDETLWMRIVSATNATILESDDEEFVTIVNDDPRRRFIPDARRAATSAW